jgi:hypothetical protein
METLLTKENAETVSTIINIKNPEWGTKKFNYSSDGFHSFGQGSNSAILFESDFHFWAIATFKNN